MQLCIARILIKKILLQKTQILINKTFYSALNNYIMSLDCSLFQTSHVDLWALKASCLRHPRLFRLQIEYCLIKLFAFSIIICVTLHRTNISTFAVLYWMLISVISAPQQTQSVSKSPLIRLISAELQWFIRLLLAKTDISKRLKVEKKKQ